MVPLIRVLLVDDEEIFVESLTKVLMRRGMVVRVALDGFTAITSISAEEFDVIVLDMQMPVMDGLTTLKAFREKDPLIPVILLTGHIDVEQVTQALKMGATEVLLKPCPIETLLSAIENAHERKAIAREAAQKG